MTSASASRVTRSRRNLQLVLLVFAGALAVVSALRAQEATAPAATQPSPPAVATPAPADGKEVASGDAARKGPAADAAPQAKPAGPSPARFEPTEKVRADFDVSFPVDI